MSGRNGRFLFTILLVLLVFGIGTRIVNAEELTGEDADAVQEEIEDAIMSEFDFDEIEKSLQEMFPEEKIEFGDVVSSLCRENRRKRESFLLIFSRI